MKLIKSCLAGLVLLGLFAGCNTPTSTIAYKGEVATDASIRTAMIGWGVYVAAHHPGTNAEQQVYNAFNAVRQAELQFVDQLAAGDTNGSQIASNLLVRVDTVLFDVIRSHTNNPH